MIIMYVAGSLYESFPFSRIWLASVFILSTLLLFLSKLVIGAITKIILTNNNYDTSQIFLTVSENISALKYLSRLRKKVIYGIILLISDIIFLALAFLISYYLRFNTGELAEINKTYIIETN